MTGLRRAGEVLFAGKRDKILKLADIHVSKILINFQLPTSNCQSRARGNVWELGIGRCEF
jgi:hypothetical protein